VGNEVILADGGGSNGARCRAWKKAIQETICIPLGLTVTVSHYLPGTFKWNPIEHRLFSQISRNWAGEPLTGIHKAIHFTDAEMRRLNLVLHDTLGR